MGSNDSSRRTPSGREQAAALAEPARTYVGWPGPLARRDARLADRPGEEAPERFDIPTRLIDEAVTSGFIIEDRAARHCRRV